MARFTVADCMANIPNRFDMTLVAAVRARQIEKNNQSQLEHDENDKPTVLALREIAENLVNTKILTTLE